MTDYIYEVLPYMDVLDGREKMNKEKVYSLITFEAGEACASDGDFPRAEEEVEGAEERSRAPTPTRASSLVP